MLCAVGVLRASGALDFGLDGIRHLVEWAGQDTAFVDALPTAMVKPFSGSAARAMGHENLRGRQLPGAGGGRFRGSTETTFYVLAVYFGAVGIQRAACGGVCVAGGQSRRTGGAIRCATGSSADDIPL